MDRSHTLSPDGEQKWPLVSKARWPRLMKRETLAEYLDLSTDKVDDLRREGLISYVMDGKLKRFDRAVIDKLLDDMSGVASQDRWLERIGAGPSRWSERLKEC